MEEFNKSIYDTEIPRNNKYDMIQLAFAKTAKGVATLDLSRIKDTSQKCTKDQILKALS